MLHAIPTPKPVILWLFKQFLSALIVIISARTLLWYLEAIRLNARIIARPTDSSRSHFEKVYVISFVLKSLKREPKHFFCGTERCARGFPWRLIYLSTARAGSAAAERQVHAIRNNNGYALRLLLLLLPFLLRPGYVTIKLQQGESVKCVYRLGFEKSERAKKMKKVIWGANQTKPNVICQRFILFCVCVCFAVEGRWSKIHKRTSASFWCV